MGLKEDTDRKVSYLIMAKFYQMITGKTMEMDALIGCIATAIQYKEDAQKRSTAAISTDSAFNKKIIGKELAKANSGSGATAKKAAKIKSQILARCKAQYFEEFQKCHMHTKPLTWEEILHHCAA